MKMMIDVEALQRHVAVWRAAGLDIAARYPGALGDVTQAAMDKCAEDLEKTLTAAQDTAGKTLLVMGRN